MADLTPQVTNISITATPPVTNISVASTAQTITAGGGLPGVKGADGSPGVGVPTGGSANQVLAKNSATDYDTKWVTGGGGAVDSVNSKTGTVVLTQDDVGDGTTYKQYSSSDKSKLAGIASGAQVNVKSDWTAGSGDAQILNKPSLATVATSGSYTDLTSKPTIPTKTSDLTNDSSFITSSGAPVQSVAGRTGAVTLAVADVSGAVPSTRTINGYDLSANRSLTASDVSAVPTTRTVNSKALSANITLSGSDIGLGNVTNDAQLKSSQLDTTATLGVDDTKVPSQKAVKTYVDTNKGDTLPSQTGNSGKFLTTNGSATSWGTPGGGGDMSKATYDAANIAQQVVGTTATQTLTNKTLTSPAISSPTGLAKADVGLSNVDNTSDATKNSATATLTNKDLTSGTNTFPTFNQSTTGNAATATKLATARNINGVAFDGSADVTVYDSTKVPTTTTVNGKALSANITLADTDVLPSQTGNSGKYLTTNGTSSSWATVSGSGDMLLGTAQTVTATKTFNAGTLLDKGQIVFDVMAYGAKGDGTTDDTTAIQSAIAAAGAKGGVVWFPQGTYKITSSLKLYTGTSPTITAYSNITLAGAGASGNNGSVIAQYTTGEDCIKGLNDVANGAQSTNVVIQNLCLNFAGATKTNSGNGLYLAQQSANGPSFQQFTISNVSAMNHQGSGKYGFNFESIIVSTIQTCHALLCANGFYLNGAKGSAWGSVSTSTTLQNCYANMATNGATGYNLKNNTYISLISCAVDYGANSTGSAYIVDSCNTVSFYGCGIECNGTVTLSNGFNITGSTQVGLYNAYIFQSKSTVEVLATSTSTGVTLIGIQSNSSVSGSTGLKVDAGSQVTEIDCNWGSVATVRNINGTGVNKQPGVLRSSAITSNSAPTPNAGTDDEYDVTALAVGATFGAPTGTPDNGQKLIIRIKDNGTARSLAWNSAYVSSGVATLPTTTVISKTMTCGFTYNSTTSKWVLLALDGTGY